MSNVYWGRQTALNADYELKGQLPRRCQPIFDISGCGVKLFSPRHKGMYMRRVLWVKGTPFPKSFSLSLSFSLSPSLSLYLSVFLCLSLSLCGCVSVCGGVVWCMCVCAHTHLQSPGRPGKEIRSLGTRVTDTNCHVVLGRESGSSARVARDLNPRTISPAQFCFFFLLIIETRLTTFCLFSAVSHYASLVGLEYTVWNSENSLASASQVLILKLFATMLGNSMFLHNKFGV